ncbi:hypothetical protein ACFLSE_03020 [Bacteroidota bacterium]
MSNTYKIQLESLSKSSVDLLHLKKMIVKFRDIRIDVELKELKKYT